MSRWRTAALLPLVVGIALVPLQALAAFHLWTFSEFFSSPDGSVQFIEMFTTSNFETVENGANPHDFRKPRLQFSVPILAPYSKQAHPARYLRL